MSNIHHGCHNSFSVANSVLTGKIQFVILNIKLQALSALIPKSGLFVGQLRLVRHIYMCKSSVLSSQPWPLLISLPVATSQCKIFPEKSKIFKLYPTSLANFVTTEKAGRGNSSAVVSTNVAFSALLNSLQPTQAVSAHCCINTVPPPDRHLRALS